MLLLSFAYDNIRRAWTNYCFACYSRYGKASKGFRPKEYWTSGRASRKESRSSNYPPTIRVTEHVKEKSPHKRSQAADTAPPSKRPRNLAETSNMVAKDFEKHALLHVEQKELNAWKARSKEEARDAIRRATTELLFHNVVEESMRVDDVARSHTLDLEKRALLKELKENKKALESLSNAKSVLEDSLKIHSQEEARLKRTLQEKEDLLLDSKRENDLLSLEILQLKADQSNICQEEKEQIHGAAYEEGFTGYVLGFLATDPEYSWEKFDPDTRKWIEDFKAENAAAIADKKLEIEAALARPEQGAEVAIEAVPIQQVEARLEESLGKDKSSTPHVEDAAQD